MRGRGWPAPHAHTREEAVELGKRGGGRRQRFVCGGGSRLHHHRRRESPWPPHPIKSRPLPPLATPAPLYPTVLRHRQAPAARQETMVAKTDDGSDTVGEGLARSCASNASMRVTNLKKISVTKGHFPRLADCAHFHYDNVDFDSIQLCLAEDHSDFGKNGTEPRVEPSFLVQIHCQGKSWLVWRSYEDFRILDKHLHLCIYDRRYSQLPELLPCREGNQEGSEAVAQTLSEYLTHLSCITDDRLNCGPVLTWMEVDNHGHRLLVSEEASFNVPAIAAAQVVRRYTAQAPDELSFEVGNFVSVLDMPPKEDTTWWRGKHDFQVGFFPSSCVEIINGRAPQSATACGHPTRAVSKKHGKLITFLRSFMKSRPSKQRLKQRGILRERVFGCDLGEYLLNSAHDVPQVVKSCAEFIERHGIVDGIYRLSGVASNIQKLRHEFDSEHVPDLMKEAFLQDIHCVSSLCKLYFRELPNPLLTYQLYDKFSEAMTSPTEEDKLVKIHDAIQQLPPPHYRTLEYLMKHLWALALHSDKTGMHSKNLAIVWAPNLLRTQTIEMAGYNSTMAFMEVRMQSVVVEFLLNHTEVLFSDRFSSIVRDNAGRASVPRPKSLLVSSSSTKLLSLEEAQARRDVAAATAGAAAATAAVIAAPHASPAPLTPGGTAAAVVVGAGGASGLTSAATPEGGRAWEMAAEATPALDMHGERRLLWAGPAGGKGKRMAGGGSWRTFFQLGRGGGATRRKLQRNPSEPASTSTQCSTFPGLVRSERGSLRSAKSEESLTSLHSTEVEVKACKPRRPRSSNDALSPSYCASALSDVSQYGSYDNLPPSPPRDRHDGTRRHSNSHNAAAEGRVDRGGARDDGAGSAERTGNAAADAAEESVGSDEDLLDPPDVGGDGLDFDPMAFHLSPARSGGKPSSASSPASSSASSAGVHRSPVAAGGVTAVGPAVFRVGEFEAGSGGGRLVMLTGQASREPQTRESDAGAAAPDGRNDPPEPRSLVDAAAILEDRSPPAPTKSGRGKEKPQACVGADAGKEAEAGAAPTPEGGGVTAPASPAAERLRSPFFGPEGGAAVASTPASEERAASKSVSFAEKMVQAFSPKAGRNSAKASPMSISEPIAITLPARVSEMIGATPATTTAAPAAAAAATAASAPAGSVGSAGPASPLPHGGAAAKGFKYLGKSPPVMGVTWSPDAHTVNFSSTVDGGASRARTPTAEGIKDGGATGDGKGPPEDATEERAARESSDGAVRKQTEATAATEKPSDSRREREQRHGEAADERASGGGGAAAAAVGRGERLGRALSLDGDAPARVPARPQRLPLVSVNDAGGRRDAEEKAMEKDRASQQQQQPQQHSKLPTTHHQHHRQHQHQQHHHGHRRQLSLSADGSERRFEGTVARAWSPPLTAHDSDIAPPRPPFPSDFLSSQLHNHYLHHHQQQQHQQQHRADGSPTQFVTTLAYTAHGKGFPTFVTAAGRRTEGPGPATAPSSAVATPVSTPFWPSSGSAGAVDGRTPLALAPGAFGDAVNSRSLPVLRTEVPPGPETVVYVAPSKSRQLHPQQQQQQPTDVMSKQPYFENGRVHYRFASYPPPPGFGGQLNLSDPHPMAAHPQQRPGSGARPPRNGAFLLEAAEAYQAPRGSAAYEPIAAGAGRGGSYFETLQDFLAGGAQPPFSLRRVHTFATRDDFPPQPPMAQQQEAPAATAWGGRHAPGEPAWVAAPGRREHSFVSRDVPPSPRRSAAAAVAAVGAARDKHPPMRRESRTRQQAKSAALVSRYDNVVPSGDEFASRAFGPAPLGGGSDAFPLPVHLRSKSDPGRFGLMPEGCFFQPGRRSLLLEQGFTLVSPLDGAEIQTQQQYQQQQQHMYHVTDRRGANWRGGADGSTPQLYALVPVGGYEHGRPMEVHYVGKAEPERGAHRQLLPPPLPPPPLQAQPARGFYSTDLDSVAPEHRQQQQQQQQQHYHHERRQSLPVSAGGAHAGYREPHAHPSSQHYPAAPHQHHAPPAPKRPSTAATAAAMAPQYESLAPTDDIGPGRRAGAFSPAPAAIYSQHQPPAAALHFMSPGAPTGGPRGGPYMRQGGGGFYPAELSIHRAEAELQVDL
uniref:Rho GTPase-activating protein 32-like isoform X3 n=2 Tax=Petromyzon marinus TaxID=7757 RepID=A0AAJ7X5A2_PETMA|nr:rho GTPase-activating protein 32-like isoform X3 [Petromyzon marinus]